MTTVLERPIEERERPIEERAPLARPQAPRTSSPAKTQAAWLAAGLALAFAVPFVFADLLELPRDLFYGIYAVAVLALVGMWGRSTAGVGRGAVTRNWRWGLGLGAVFAGLMALVAVRTEESTAHPDGARFAAAIAWRGVVYGATDGLLLSVFPIVVVFAAFAGTAVRKRLVGKALIGALALAASLAFTAVYHAGYADFRSSKIAKPLSGDVIWSAPTLLTLSPLGAPLAHVGLHVGAVVHSYETDVFLPPHEEPTGSAHIAGSGAGALRPGEASYQRVPEEG